MSLQAPIKMGSVRVPTTSVYTLNSSVHNGHPGHGVHTRPTGTDPVRPHYGTFGQAGSQMSRRMSSISSRGDDPVPSDSGLGSDENTGQESMDEFVARKHRGRVRHVETE